ncbi:uncharacterized protein K489DRAFT_94637 [Dissoconium aciculare CBS 342.82]|uniref:Uncharacterized protein n=1 Tax=Dissoconium aciculare CBS 342.82 TaxID=1314786 RepID=A0A6J3LRJ5_9PEZI|nr:uncharacterized protein K489DRAFT_94637 [Dissoconium aciculare CBS 342.82]KAF1818456.1 hypothetical protein K489DRAFT_94637 [Dissoconium aciculare CBS 342.82]
MSILLLTSPEQSKNYLFTPPTMLSNSSQCSRRFGSYSSAALMSSSFFLMLYHCHVGVVTFPEQAPPYPPPPPHPAAAHVGTTVTSAPFRRGTLHLQRTAHLFPFVRIHSSVHHQRTRLSSPWGALCWDTRTSMTREARLKCLHGLARRCEVGRAWGR